MRRTQKNRTQSTSGQQWRRQEPRGRRQRRSQLALGQLRHLGSMVAGAWGGGVVADGPLPLMTRATARGRQGAAPTPNCGMEGGACGEEARSGTGSRGGGRSREIRPAAAVCSRGRESHELASGCSFCPKKYLYNSAAQGENIMRPLIKYGCMAASAFAFASHP